MRTELESVNKHKEVRDTLGVNHYKAGTYSLIQVCDEY